jgi:serine/threonine-protein kinase
MAPEQARGDVAGPAADRYSLACIAYQLLTGRPPFDAESPHAIIHGHIARPAPLVSERNPALPAAVDAVMSTALAKDPADRYPTAAAFVHALGSALATEGGANGSRQPSDDSDVKRQAVMTATPATGARSLPGAPVLTALLLLIVLLGILILRLVGVI